MRVNLTLLSARTHIYTFKYCIVWKSCRLGLAKRRSQEYNKLYRSGESTKTVLTDKSIHYIIRQLENGRDIMVMAEEMKVSQQHIQRLWAEYFKTGTIHIQGRVDGPRAPNPLMSRQKWCWIRTVAGQMECS